MRVKKLIKEIKPDVLHAHYAGVNGVLGMLSGFHPYILTAWGSDVLIVPQKNVLIRALIKRALGKADLITCDGKNSKKRIIELGFGSKVIKMIYFGVDVEKFSPGPENQKLLKKLRIDKNSSVVISLRNLEPVYNLETLIRAVPAVLSKNPRTVFIIAGKGSEEKKVKDLANKLDVSGNIRFVGWISSNLPDYLRISDIYVSTSLSDAGISVSTAEAMACSLPVIITDFGDNKEWVENGKNGFLISLKDSNDLAQKIVYLLKNKKIGYNFGEINREMVKEKYNSGKELEKMKKIYIKFKK